MGGADHHHQFLSTAEGGLGGEALYCAVILWLSVMSWIIFSWVGSDGDGVGKGRRSRRRRGGGSGSSRGSPVFVGYAGFCDGTGPGCSGGYGICGTCID